MSRKRTYTVLQSENDTSKSKNYYCLRCEGVVLVTAGAITSSERRMSDGAYCVMDNLIQSKHLERGPVTKILRVGRGAETQHRLKCEHCKVIIGYKEVDIDDFGGNGLLYIFPGILSSNPTISLDSINASELHVPTSIVEGKYEDADVVMLTLKIAFGAHTKLQISDITDESITMQLRSRFKDNEIQINATILKFFQRLLSNEKGDNQLLPRDESKSYRTVAIAKASCGYIYQNLLKVMIDPVFIYPGWEGSKPQ
eukprot:TRINITY_DN5166_c0_g1_i1.p1 TRINITY_DN5166_c0_g1~~TRINITY_DN5166_c0_g1_i1.p1  ORF type:complete len:273 (+),score=51.81 TRINITY_DN5166_c0_g1_i1:55-819(+)